MKRMGMVIGIRAEHIEDYRRLHAAVWPAVLARLAASNIRNYSIYLRQPENLLFGTWEYHGSDFEADMAAIAADPETRHWWTFCGPCQVPLESRAPGEHWAMMEEVFHAD
jgi:L-rhamnose mutarotase